MIDNFGKLLKQDDAFIVNTDKSNGEGIHWIVMFPQDDKLFIVDSLGKKNERPYDKIMFNTIRKHGLKPYFYHDSFQYADNSMCGWFAIYVSKLINANKDADLSQMLDDIFKNNGADDKDIEVLIKHFGRDDDTLKKKYNLDIEVDGSGILSFIKSFGRKTLKKISDVGYAIKGTRDDFKPSMRDLLKRDGDVVIKRIKVCRAPISSKIPALLNIYNKIVGFKAPPHDQLYHLYIIFYLNNDHIVRIEKNQELNAEYYRNAPEVEECVDVNLNKKISMNTMLKNVINVYGKDRVFRYDAFSNNCQRFILDLLLSNDIVVSTDLYKFIFQDVSDLTDNFGKKITSILTDLSNRMGIIISGKGIEYEFRKSMNKKKKYDVILDDGSIVSFGDINSQHYHDRTPLKLYSHLDHNDVDKRKNFKQRFSKLIKKTENDVKSPMYWSNNYLWF